MAEEARFLLVKRGLYYRPDNRGYTGKKSEAGRYHENERRQLEGVDAIHEDDAGEYAPSCWMETKLADKDARIAELGAHLACIEEEAPTPEQTQGAVEAVARAIERQFNSDADGLLADPNDWPEWKPEALAAIAALDAFKKNEVGHG